jgi:hypothetical protein
LHSPEPVKEYGLASEMSRTSTLSWSSVACVKFCKKEIKIRAGKKVKRVKAYSQTPGRARLRESVRNLNWEIVWA